MTQLALYAQRAETALLALTNAVSTYDVESADQIEMQLRNGRRWVAARFGATDKGDDDVTLGGLLVTYTAAARMRANNADYAEPYQAAVSALGVADLRDLLGHRRAIEPFAQQSLCLPGDYPFLHELMGVLVTRGDQLIAAFGHCALLAPTLLPETDHLISGWHRFLEDHPYCRVPGEDDQPGR